MACDKPLLPHDAKCPNCGAVVFEYEEIDAGDTPQLGAFPAMGGSQNASRSFKSQSQYMILYKWRGFFLTSMERKLNSAWNNGWELVAVSPGIMFTAAYMRRRGSE